MTERACRGFIACSSDEQAKQVADGIARSLRQRLKQLHGVERCDVRPWFFCDDLNGDMLLPALLKKADNIDFAVVVLHPDDPTEIRGQSALITRDNVVFELGIFLAKLSLERVFVFKPESKIKNFRALTDIDGIIAYTYDAGGSAEAASASWEADVDTHCSDIARRVTCLPVQPPSSADEHQAGASVQGQATGNCASESSAARADTGSEYVISGVDEHMNLLRKFAHSKSDQFYFMGTIVGFSYVMPPQLARAVVEGEYYEYTVNVIGSRYVLKFPVAERRLFIFPYAFVLKTIRGILAACERQELREKIRRRVIFKVHYYPKDIIDAVCSVSRECWFQSQGLDPKQINLYLDQYRDRYVGIRLPVENDHIARYMEVIERRQHEAGDMCQTWVLEIGRDGFRKLDISGCFFLDYEDDHLKTLEEPRIGEPRSFNGDEVKNFAETRYEALTRLVPSIGEIDGKIRESFPHYFD